jgi:integrase
MVLSRTREARVAWVEDRWTITVTGEDGNSKKVPSRRQGSGLRWRVRYETADGRERSKSFARKPDADRFCTKVGADLLRGTYLDPDAGKISLRKYAETWLAAQTFDESTRETAGRRLAHILEGLGDKRLDQLAASPSAIQAWVKGLRMAPSTVGQCLGALSAILQAAVDDKRMVSNPCRTRSVRAPAVPKRKVVPLEAGQLAAVRDALPARYRAMADAGALCGMRQGEIFGVAVDDIDFLRRTVHVLRQVKIVGGAMTFALPKRGKTRDVPLSATASERFAEHIRRFPPVRVTLPWHEPGTKRHGRPVTVTLMFTTPLARRPVHRQNFNYREWKAVLKAAGLVRSRENGMHILRHTYASMLLANGTDIRRVAACLGHDDPAFTLRVYMHLMEGGEEQVRQALDRALTVPSPAREAK